MTVGELYALERKFNWGALRRATLMHLLASFRPENINHPLVLTAYAEIDAASDAIGVR